MALETRADFAAPGHALEAGVSLDRRPDALSWDYRTAFAPGPRTLGDPAAGLAERAWRVRADGTAVHLARAADGGAGWEAESPLFAFDGPPALEVDLAFDQNARAVVCVERATGAGGAPEVWIYNYDAQAAGYLFRRLGPGRTPRVILDEPYDTQHSDVLLFYVSDAADALVYRVQRDRFAAETATPLTGVAHYYLEEVARGSTGRLQTIGSTRDPATGRYALRYLESALYPHYTRGGPAEGFSAAGAVRGAQVLDVVLRPPTAPEGVDVGHRLRALVVGEPFVQRTEVQQQSITAGHVLRQMAVRPLVFRVDQADPGDRGITAAHALRGLQVRGLTITHRQPHDGTSHTASHTLRGLQVRALIRTVRQPDDGSSHTAAHALRGLMVRALIKTHRQPDDGTSHTAQHTLRGLQVRPLIRTVRQPADSQHHTAAHTLRGASVVYLVRQSKVAGQPELGENRHDPRHSIRSVAVVRV